MDKMNSDNNLNASTSVGSKESGIKSLQVVKRAIATNEKYSYLEHTHRNLEKAINEFDLQGSHILAEDWIKEAENAYRLLHPLELQPEIQREITTVMLSQMIYLLFENVRPKTKETSKTNFNDCYPGV